MFIQNKKILLWLFVITVVASTFLILNFEPHTLQDNFKNGDSEDSNPKLWISMGLCFSEGNKMKQKNEVFFTSVAPLAITLWERFSNARVILSVIYIKPKNATEEAKLRKSKEGFEDSLSSTSTIIDWIPLEESDSMSCATKSQLIRMFGFRHPIVGPDDIVMTADVDALIASPELLAPLSQTDKNAWIFQYGHTLTDSDVGGANFALCFIAMRNSYWHRVFKKFPTPDSLYLEMYDVLHIDSKNQSTSWYTDQWSATYLILREGICTLPETISTWKMLGLKYSPKEEGCYHGGLENSCCDLHRHLPKCLWWHFYSHEKREAARAKFLEITAGEFDVDSPKDSPYYYVTRRLS